MIRPLSFVFGFALLISTARVLAQSDALVPIDDDPSSAIQAVITGPQDIAVGRTVVLDASFSRVTGEDVQYQWFIGGGTQPISRTLEAVYTPEKTGEIIFRLVLSSMIDGQRVVSETTKTVTVYSRKILLVADASVPQDKLDLHSQAAAEAGVFLRVLQIVDASTPLGSEEALTALLSEQKETVAGANAIVLWTEGITGLQALMRALQDDQELLTSVRNQTVILITNRSLQTLARTAQGPFSVLRPQQILLTRKEAINPLLVAETTEQFIQEIDQRDIDWQRIDDSTAGLRPWNVLSWLVNAMLTRGVPSQTVLLLLVLPVIATILAFMKQVVGITTFGLYTPSIIALSFLAVGWSAGIVFLIFILVATYATRAVMQRWRLLYIPKVAIILTAVSLSLLLLMGLGSLLGMTFSRETVFILLIMSTLAESFLNLKTEQGWFSAILGVGETIIAALLCVFIVQWAVFQSVVLAYPELLLLTVIINVILGRWTGLRLVEYFRFREVFKHLQEE